MKVQLYLTSLLTFGAIVSLGDSYRILAIFSYNGQSHFMMYERLLKGLAERGHQVDVVSHFPLKKPFPNYNQVVNLDGTLPFMRNNVSYGDMKVMFSGKSFVASAATRFGADLCDLMDVPEFRRLIRNPPRDPPYDVLVTEIAGAACYLALGHHFKVPIVGTVTNSLWPWASDGVANPDNPAYIPSVLSGFRGDMNFWERLRNTLELITEKWEYDHYSAYQDEQIKKYIGPHALSLREARRNVSLILVNTHFSFNGPRPFTTAVVEVGGLHVSRTAELLSNELERWLNDSKDGFVYISFGSMTRIESFPKETLDALYRSLAKLSPIRVVMKIARPEELPRGLPKNVFTNSWIPQLAVLAHKHIRAFMTHGGLMGVQEAVHYGVPMIGVPLFSDQVQNVNNCVRKHVAVYLSHDDITEEKLDAAFDSVLGDPSYIEAAKRLSVEFRNRPTSALDTAVFWVEYVARHGGSNLRSPAMDLTWWQIALLDVIGVLLFAAAVLIYLLSLVIKMLMDVANHENIQRGAKTKKSE